MLIQSLHRFNVSEYYRMGETGLLRPDARVELLDGQVIDMSPIGSFHGGVVTRLIQLLTKDQSGRWLVICQNPVHLDDHSEPQPDLMMARPCADSYTGHLPRPEDVFLLIEVADSTLGFDREEKLPRYGHAGIAEVWIVNLVDRTIETYREPHFSGYGLTAILQAGDKAIPAAFPDLVIDVSSLVKR